MAEMIPIEHDPFAPPAATMVPVDHDPFAPKSPGVFEGAAQEAVRGTKEQAEGAWENLSGAFARRKPEPNEGFWEGYGRDVAEVPGKAWKFAKGAAGAAGLPLAPVLGGATSLVGRGVVAPAIQKAGEFINPEAAKNTNPEQIYEDIRGDVTTALGAAKPRGTLPGQTPGMLPARPSAPPDTARQAARNVLDREGVEYTAGQLSGNMGSKYREAMAGVPADLQRQRSLEQLTRSAARRIGEDTPNIHEAVQTARPRIVNDLENATQKLVVHSDPKLMGELINIEKEAIQRGHAPDSPIVREIQAMRDNVLGAFNVPMKGNRARLEMPGKNFHELIRKDSHIESSVSTPGPVGIAARQIQRALFDAAERTATRQGTQPGKGAQKTLADFRDARHKYANLKAIEDVASSAGADVASGLLSPSHIRQLATFRNKSDYARGRGDFNDLARASNHLLTPLPNSGTTQRLLAGAPARLLGGILGGGLGAGTTGVVGGAGGAALGAAAAPWLQGHVLMSRPVQNLAKRRWDRKQDNAARRDSQRSGRLAIPLAVEAAALSEHKRNPNPFAP